MAEFKDISPNASAGAKLTNWFENRFPTAFDAYKVHMSEYYAPKNFNFWYIFGTTSPMLRWPSVRWNTSCAMCHGVG